nr:TetR/AcrR family transcriptional regulator [Micromonospora sp. DSM 115978]
MLREAARLFAERGYHGVSIEQIGAAVGIRGPGIYRHVASKEAMLVEMLTGVSEQLLAGGQAELAAATGPADALDRLVRRHVAFALTDPDLIVVHDRDLTSLPADAARRVRRLQRTYVELWVDVLRTLHEDPAGRSALSEAQARARAHALFGLINSTPHSAVGLPHETMAEILRTMALAAALSA